MAQVDHLNGAFAPSFISTNRIDAQGSERLVEPTFVEVELVWEVTRSVCHEKIRQVFQNFLPKAPSVRHATVRNLNQEIRFAPPKQHWQHSAHQPLIVRPPPLSNKMDETLGGRYPGALRSAINRRACNSDRERQAASSI